MNFTSFTENILKNLKRRLGEEYTVFSQLVKKNNGVELTGIVVRKKSCNASPTVYIDSYYREDITEEELVKIADMIYDNIKKAQLEDNIDMSGFLDYEKAKSRLAYKLIHAKKNQKLLREIPHKRFYNLARVLYYAVHEAPFLGKANILINNAHAERWGVGTKELFEEAAKNTPRLFPGIIENIEDVMCQMLEDTCGDTEMASELTSQMREGLANDRIPMYVLSNRQKLNGAACMLYPDVLKNFAAGEGQDLYLLPSSVHEVILVPADAGISREALWDMVREINRTQVAQEEVLADSIYYYSRARDKILWLT